MKSSMCTWTRSAALTLALTAGSGIAMAQMGGGAPQQSPGNTSSASAPATQQQMDSMQSSPAMQSGMAASEQDKTFLKKAVQSSNFEIKAGKLAQKNSDSQDVKDFGKQMEADHTKLNNAMLPVAQDAGKASLPMGVPDKDKDELKKLKSLKGQAFDQEYIKTMAMSHQEAVQAFKQEASQGQLPAEKQAAQQGLPIIQQHLEMAQKLAQSHNISTNATM